MPANKNALIRYKTIDNCLRNRFRKWTLEDLVNACSCALYDTEGISKGVSVRTVQSDIQIMRSDKLGYNAPIEVYDHKYYRYADSEFSITNMPMSQNDYAVMQEAIDMLRQLGDFGHFAEMSDVIGRLREKLAITSNAKRPIIRVDSVPMLKGLHFLNPLYNFIVYKTTVRIMYQSFYTKQLKEFILYPYLLKEFRNRWYIFGSSIHDMYLYNLSLDRIVSVEPTDIPYKDNPNFDADHFFDDVIGVSKGINNVPKEIKFWANAEQSNYIKTKPIHSSQELKSENPEDGSCVFMIKVVENYELYSVFMSYGPGIKIIAPNDVVKSMKEKLNETIAMYSDE